MFPPGCGTVDSYSAYSAQQTLVKCFPPTPSTDLIKTEKGVTLWGRQMDKVNTRCRLLRQLWGQMPQEHRRRVINLGGSQGRLPGRGTSLLSLKWLVGESRMQKASMATWRGRGALVGNDRLLE